MSAPNINSAPASTLRAQAPVAGVLWMLASGALFVGVNAIVRHVGDGLPAAEMAFLRYAIGLVFVLPMLRPLLSARPTRRQLALAGARGAVHTVAVTLWFYAMARIPLAEVTALNYLSPIGVTIGAALLLNEGFSFRRLAAVAVALAGALVILRPGLREISDGHVAMLVGASFFAASYLIAKVLSDELPPQVVVAMMSVSVAIGLAPLAWAVWQPPSLAQVGWMALCAALATVGHICMTFAFRAAPVAVTQPVTFLQLVWATLLGYFAFGEALDPWVFLGGAVIIGAVSFITWREWVLKRRAVTPATNATKL